MRQKGLNTTWLKAIAMIFMFIDHAAEVVLRPMLLSQGLNSITMEQMKNLGETDPMITVFIVMRVIGRLAFPIFAFMIVEGVLHTKNIAMYAARLLAIAVISEVPFDLAFYNKFLDLTYQNTIFTLLFGVLALWGFDTIERAQKNSNDRISGFPMLIAIVAAFLGIILAEFLYTDYGGTGVLLILILYFARSSKKVQIFAGILGTALINPISVLAFIPIFFYNGEKGSGNKYIFYAFYPLHLLLLYMICVFLHIEQYISIG